MDVLVNSELLLYGAVGDSFFDDGFTARDVVNALATLRGKPVNVRLNSGGGYSDEGVAIYNSLKNHNAAVTVYIDGVAASAASLIAMAGEKIVMRTGSTMMVHDPMMICIGNAADMRKSIEQLDTAANSMADIYAKKTGRSATDIRAEMREELWMTPAEAVAKGYADETADDAAIEASAFDYRAYARAPERMVALSDERLWSNTLRRPHAALPKQKQKEPPMADTVTKEAAAAEAEARAKAETDRATAIIDECVKAGVPTMASALIKAGDAVEAAKAKITAEGERVTAIRQKCEAAKPAMGKAWDASLADQFIASGITADAAGSKLMDRIVEVQNAQAQTRSQHDGGRGDDKGTMTPNASTIYAGRATNRAKMAIVD